MSFSAQEAALKRYPSRRPSPLRLKVLPPNSYHRLGRPSVAGFFFLLLYLLAVPAARAAVMIEPR
ncbi:MAG: hypothetical protein WBZ35_22125, partial [Pseudolabrys sp.]